MLGQSDEVSQGTIPSFIANADKLYGSDPYLHNGEIDYTSFATVKGDPFYYSPDFVSGSVTIKGVSYEDQWLRYDIYRQLLLLEFQNNIGATVQIVVSDAWLEGFRIRDQVFLYTSFDGMPKQYYQAIGTGDIRCLYHWAKEMKFNSGNFNTGYFFTKPHRKCYISGTGKILRYTSNAGFLKFFDEGKRMEVKAYMHQQRINVRKAPDELMSELMTFCNTLISK